MWELDCEEGWAPKNWCLWTVVLEKTLESPLGCKEIQPVHSEGDQPWDFFGRNDAKAETPVLWTPHVKSWLIGKDIDAGRDWGQEEKGTTEDEMVGWHHWLKRREFEQALGVSDGQGSLACCSPWSHKELDTTERLNWTVLPIFSSRRLMVSGLTFLSLICFEFTLYMVIENVLVLFFYVWMSSFPNTTHWRDCLFPIVNSCLLCCRLNDQKCVGFFLDCVTCLH